MSKNNDLDDIARLLKALYEPDDDDDDDDDEIADIDDINEPDDELEQLQSNLDNIYLKLIDTARTAAIRGHAVMAFRISSAAQTILCAYTQLHTEKTKMDED